MHSFPSLFSTALYLIAPGKAELATAQCRWQQLGLEELHETLGFERKLRRKEAERVSRNRCLFELVLKIKRC